MKDYFHTKGFKALLTAAFVLLALMLYTATSGSSLTANALGLLTTPMQRVSTLAATNASAAAEPVLRSNEELLAENVALRQQLDETNNKLVNYYSLQLENAQLRKYLELKNENRDFKPVPAAVIARDPNDLFYGFQIDQGTNAGISLGDPVITDAGVVGWISAVNTSYSRVTTILSPDTQIYCTVLSPQEGKTGEEAAARDSGVASSDIRLADAGKIKLGYLPADTPVKPGDLITTNGLGGKYPRNLPIGTVLNVQKEAYDVSLYAEVQPFVDVKTVRDVMVITYFEGQGETLEAMESGGAAAALTGTTSIASKPEASSAVPASSAASSEVRSSPASEPASSSVGEP